MAMTPPGTPPGAPPGMPPSAPPFPEVTGPDRTAGVGGRLARAGRALQAEPETGWAGVSATVVAAVRATARRSWPVEADVHDLPSEAGRPGDRVLVSDHVLRAELSRAVGTAEACAVEDVVVRLDRRRLVGVDVVVVARYGLDLHALAGRVRAVVLGVLGELLGASVPRQVTDAVQVHVGDVTWGDPRTS